MDRPPVIQKADSRGDGSSRSGVIRRVIVLAVIVAVVASGLVVCSRQHQGLKSGIPHDIPPDVRQQIEKLYAGRHEAEQTADEFGKLGDRAVLAVPFLTKMLHDHSLSQNDRPVERGEIAARALGSIGSPVVEAVIPLVEDEDPIARQDAIRALTWTADPRGVEPMINALKDQDDGVRGQAAYGLGQLKDRRAVGPLCQKLHDPHPGRAVILALGSIGGDQATEALIGLLKVHRHRTAIERWWEGDPETANRWDAAEALGKPGNSRAVEPLVAALNDRYYYVREHAARALGKIGDLRAVEPLIEFLNRSDRDTGERGSFSRSEVVTSLKAAAVDALGELGDARAVSPLAPLLNYGDEYFREGVVEALSKIRDPQAVPLLINALKDPHEFVWLNAATKLGKIGDPDAVQPLVDALKRKTGIYVAGHADVAQALKEITGQDLGEDPAKWQEWCNENKRTLIEKKQSRGSVESLQQ